MPNFEQAGPQEGKSGLKDPGRRKFLKEVLEATVAAGLALSGASSLAEAAERGTRGKDIGKKKAETINISEELKKLKERDAEKDQKKFNEVKQELIKLWEERKRMLQKMKEKMQEYKAYREANFVATGEGGFDVKVDDTLKEREAVLDKIENEMINTGISISHLELEMAQLFDNCVRLRLKFKTAILKEYASAEEYIQYNERRPNKWLNYSLDFSSERGGYGELRSLSSFIKVSEVLDGKAGLSREYFQKMAITDDPTPLINEEKELFYKWFHSLEKRNDVEIENQ